MYDPNAESSRRALAELGKLKVRKILLRIAYQFTRSEAEAEDLIADTLLVVLDPERDPWEKGSFVSHMAYAMRHAWGEKMKTWAARNIAPDEGVTRDESTASNEETPPDDHAHDRRTLQAYRSMGAQLLLEIGAKHPVAKRVFELGAQGVEDAEEQAAIIGCTVKEIHRARELLKDHGRRIREEHEQTDERRMRELREKAATKKRESGTEGES
jgi:DNA-directed RNA polymerase specialized sigma24 family protein